jgi:integrase
VLFLIQRYTGRRIGQLVSLKLEQINFETRHINFQKNKVRYKDKQFERVKLVEPLFFQLNEYVEGYRRAIESHGSYLFFTTDPKATTPFISTNACRKIFRKILERIGLVESYGHTIERAGRKTRKLFRLSTHSFRYTLGERLIWDLKEKPQVASAILGHEKLETTLKYAQKPPQELTDATMEKLAKKL